MISPFGLMYLRPGNLWTDFVIKRKTVHNANGHPVSEFEEKGKVSGILAEASSNESDRMKHRWDQEQHSLTHTLVIRDSADVKQGDYLTTAGRTFLVLLCEDPGNLGATGLIYLEERNDLK